MKNNNYITGFGWMFNELGLKCNEALIFMLIYGFCQDGVSTYNGSLTYIQKTFNISRNTVINSLKKLEDQNCIVKVQKTENNVTYNTYSLGSAISALGSAKTDSKVVQKLTEGSAKTAPNNTIYNNIIDRDTALAFLKVNCPSRFEAWQMKNKNRIDNWPKFTTDFNNKVIIEGLDFDVKKLFARLEIFAGNWMLNNKKYNQERVNEASKIKWS